MLSCGERERERAVDRVCVSPCGAFQQLFFSLKFGEGASCLSKVTLVRRRLEAYRSSHDAESPTPPLPDRRKLRAMTV